MGPSAHRDRKLVQADCETKTHNYYKRYAIRRVCATEKLKSDRF